MGLLETYYSTKLAPYSQGRTRSTYVIPGVCLFHYYLNKQTKKKLLILTLYFAFFPLYGEQITSLMQELSILLSLCISKCDLWRAISFCLVGFPGYSSSSSSTTSLEGKQNYSKKRNSTSSNKKPLTRASSVSSKISAGMIIFSRNIFKLESLLLY